MRNCIQLLVLIFIVFKDAGNSIITNFQSNQPDHKTTTHDSKFSPSKNYLTKLQPKREEEEIDLVFEGRQSEKKKTDSP